jgi:shikimate dehydrogenase
MPSPANVLTLRDLESWSRAGTSLAVLGQPIKHSISPAMHNAALRAAAKSDGEFADWQYFRFELAPADLPRALELLHAKRFRGVNLTVPHKVIAFSRVAAVDAAAQPCGAVNTLRWQPDGWRGFNTDGYGLSAAIRETLGLSLPGATVVLLGAGGAARGAAVQCLQERCASLVIVNRSQPGLDELLATIAPLRATTDIRGVLAADVPRDVFRGAVVINATSAGLKAEDPLPVNLLEVERPAAVYDMIYNPPETKLLRQCTERGIPHANGLSMLVHQGAKALEIWSGLPAAQTAPVMADAARAALA